MSGPLSTQGDVRLLARVVPMARPDAWLYALAFLCAPATAALVVLQPYLLKLAIDDYMIPGDIEGLRRLAFGYLAAVVIAFAAQAMYTLLLSYASVRTITRVRTRVYEHTLSMAQNTFDVEPTGKLLTRATSDVEALGETLTAGAITLVIDVLLVLGILAAMVALDWRLTLIMVLVAPVIVVVLDRVRRVLRRLYLRVRTALSNLNAFTAERLHGLEVVQLYADETRTLAQYDERLIDYRDAAIRTNVWDAFLYAAMDGLRVITMALVLWYGGASVFEGAMTAGLLAAFLDYVSRLYRPIQEFSSKVAILQRAASALQKIFGLLDHADRITPGDVELKGFEGRLVMRDVRFRYRDGPEVLRGVDLQVNPGETVAVVGRTGSGKTTIAKLLVRLYDGYEGSITVDGEELRRVTPTSVRRAVGMVRQDVQLFPGDVRFNLTLGREVDDAALNTAVDRVHAMGAVERLGGLDGRVETGGTNLSAGEAQLLAFARTMVHDPPFVILDEATASVDSLTEARLQAATDEVLSRRTVLVIAHRLSTIVRADRIVVMDAGQVVEVGTHPELLALGGVYARLFEADLARASG